MNTIKNKRKIMMNIKYKNILVCAMCSILVVACSPKKEEKKQLPPPAKVEQKGDTLLSYPDTGDLEKQKQGQKPSGQEQELQINEDNVMNPIPG